MKKQLFLLITISLFTQSILFAQDYALEFDGIASRVKYSDDATLQLLNGATDYTIEAWIKPTTGENHNDVIIKRYYQFALTMYQDANNRIYFTHYTTGGSAFYVNSEYNVLNINEWNHVAVICNSAENTLKLYVNGVDVTADSSGASTSYPALALEADPDAANATYHPNFYAGYSGNDSVPTGFIDKIRVKNTAEDIANLQTSITDANYSTDANTILLLNFDEGTGDTTVNEVNGVNANLQCTGGCAELPEWILLADTLSLSNETTISYTLFPNPTKDQFTVQANTNESIQAIEVVNILGQTVKSLQFDTSINSVNVDISNLSSGQYFVTTKTNIGKGVKKLVIK